jgi:hypothetical protein
MLSTTVSDPQPRRRSAALEHMLNNLETVGDLLSGSECSSLATSPVHENVFAFENVQSSKQHRGRIDEFRLGVRSLDPVEIVRDFLNHMSERDVAREFVAEDAKVECHSVIDRGGEKQGEAPRAAQRDLDDLLTSCSRCDLEIDGIFACGEDVAAFGRLAYSDGPSIVPQDVHFSIWACVDVARERIVQLRWLDQIGRAKDDREDRQ